MTDKLSKKQRSYNMSRIKGKNTNPELILKKLLKKSGYKFSSVKLFGSPDIVLRRKKITINKIKYPMLPSALPFL